MFSWRQNSKKIFNKILSTNSFDDSEEETDSDEDDLTSSFSFFGSSSQRSEAFPSAANDEEIEKKLKPWKDLTNIDMGPYAQPAKRATLTSSIQRQSLRSISTADGKKEEVNLPEVNQSLTLKFQYLIMSEKLKVTVTKVNNLTKSSTRDKDVDMLAKICISPSKLQPMKTRIIKGLADPEFNTVVYFSGVSLQEMHLTSLRVAMYYRNKRSCQFENIAEVSMSLENCDLTLETTIKLCLDEKSQRMPRRQDLLTTKLCKVPEPRKFFNPMTNKICTH